MQLAAPTFLPGDEATVDGECLLGWNNAEGYVGPPVEARVRIRCIQKTIADHGITVEVLTGAIAGKRIYGKYCQLRFV